MRDCPAFIQILTRDLKGTAREFGTVKEEYAWYDEIRPDGSIAVFVEEGVQLGGQIKYEVEPLTFDSSNLGSIAPDVVEYLSDLRRRVEVRAATSRNPSDILVAILHGTESWGQSGRKSTVYGPDEWESWCRSKGFAVERISVRDIQGRDDTPRLDAIVNPFGEMYPEADPDKETSLTSIVAYVESGGLFVCTAGWPFYYASHRRAHADGTRLKRAFQVDVNDEQWWVDFEPVTQPEGSVRKWGELAHKGGDFHASIWRPVREGYGAVEKALVAAERDGVVLGFLPRGRGGVVLSGMALNGPVEFDKLTSFLETLLLKGHHPKRP